MSVVVGALAYLYLIITLLMSTGEGLSFTTFVLWGTLAGIIGFNMLSQGANPTVPFIYGTGAAVTAVILLCKGRMAKSILDLVIAVLVAVCLVLWVKVGPTWALILSVAAVGIAPIPFIVMAWKDPANSPIIPNAGFLLANILSFAGAKALTLGDLLYPSVNVLVCLLLVIPWVKYQMAARLPVQV